MHHHFATVHHIEHGVGTKMLSKDYCLPFKHSSINSRKWIHAISDVISL